MFLILTTAFLDILGFSIFLPVFPSIIQGFGVNPSWSGYTQAIYALGMFVGGLFFGRLSDTYGRKKILTYTSIINLASYIIMLVSVWTLVVHTGDAGEVSITDGDSIGLSHLSEFFYGFTPIFTIFLLSRFIGGLGGAGFGVIQAYISDISAPTERMKNMGMMGAAFGTAFLVGPAIGGLLSELTSIHATIILCIVIIAINVFSILVFLPEPKKHVHTEEIHLTDFHFSHTIILLLVLSFGTTLGFSAVQSMSGQFYADRFHFTSTQIGYTMAIVGIVSIVYQGWLVKYLRQRLDEMTMIRFSFFVLAAGLLGLGLNRDPYILFVWVALFPIGMGSFNPSVGSLMAQNAGKEVGKVMGYNTSVQSIGQIFGPIIAGLLYIVPGSGIPFFFSTAIFVFLFILAFWTKK